MIKEYWKPVVGYEGLYEVSSQGRVKSLGMGTSYNSKERILHPSKSSKYLLVTLYKDGMRHYKKVHRLVAEAFIPNPNNYPCVNHKDQNPRNNCVDNLEWCSVVYNNNYGDRNEKMKDSLTSKSVPLKYKAILQIDTNGNIVERYDAIKFVKDKGYCPSDICNVCKGKQKSAYGFLWRYADDNKVLFSQNEAS